MVGGSASGFFTAKLLAQAGRRVRVLERETALNPLPRTLIVTPHFRKLLGGTAECAIVNEIRRFELFADGRTATVPLREPDLMIERTALIRRLAAEAEAAGAEILYGRRFIGLGADGKCARVRMERDAGTTESWHAATVVGADGAFSHVARAAGWPAQPTVPLVQARVRWPENIPSDTVRVWFIPEDTPYFYWLMPESPTHGVLGLIGEDGRETRRCLERFLKTQGLAPLNFQGARIPRYARWIPVHRRVGKASVYLVGDAAGQVKVTTVGGIVTGFRGAAGVAEAILNGGASSELGALRRELDLHLWIRRAMHHFQQDDFVRLFDLLHPPAVQPLGAYHRDAAARMLWRLCLRQPRLILFGLRALLTGDRSPAVRPPAAKPAGAEALPGSEALETSSDG